MKIYFIKVGSKYLSKGAKITIPLDENLKYTVDNNQARYWDKVRTCKGINTYLHNNGIKSYIVEADVVEKLVFGEELK